jgi:hypothetical protein
MALPVSVTMPDGSELTVRLTGEKRGEPFDSYDARDRGWLFVDTNGATWVARRGGAWGYEAPEGRFHWITLDEGREGFPNIRGVIDDGGEQLIRDSNGKLYRLGGSKDGRAWLIFVRQEAKLAEEIADDALRFVPIHLPDGSSFKVAMTLGSDPHGWRDDEDGVGWERVDGKFVSNGGAFVRPTDPEADNEWPWVTIVTAKRDHLLDATGQAYVIAHGEPRMEGRERQFLIELIDDTDSPDGAESEANDE